MENDRFLPMFQKREFDLRQEKLILSERLCIKTRFETDGKRNSEITYLIHWSTETLYYESPLLTMYHYKEYGFFTCWQLSVRAVTVMKLNINVAYSDLT